MNEFIIRRRIDGVGLPSASNEVLKVTSDLRGEVEATEGSDAVLAYMTLMQTSVMMKKMDKLMTLRTSMK